PIMGFVLLQSPAEQARAIALATLVAFPAMVAHMLAFAHASRRGRWWLSLTVANGVFLMIGLALARLDLSGWAVGAVALASPVVGMRAMPAHRVDRHALHIPRIELALRVAAAVALAAAIMLGTS